MIKLISKDKDGERLCFMTLAELYKYIYKPDKEVSYYQAYERNGKYSLAGR